jgi:hypothetical protein
MPLPVPGPVDHEGLPPDLLALQESPVAAVLGVVAVVAHDEIGVCGNGDRTVLRRVAQVAVAGIGLFKRLAVDEDPALLDEQLLAAHGHYALDEIAFLVPRILEDDDITPRRVPEVEDEFVDQDVVPDQQGGAHRSRGNGERLDDEGPDQESQEHGDDDGFGVLPEERFFLFLLPLFNP